MGREGGCSGCGGKKRSLGAAGGGGDGSTGEGEGACIWGVMHLGVSPSGEKKCNGGQRGCKKDSLQTPLSWARRVRALAPGAPEAPSLAQHCSSAGRRRKSPFDCGNPRPGQHGSVGRAARLPSPPPPPRSPPACKPGPGRTSSSGRRGRPCAWEAPRARATSAPRGARPDPGCGQRDAEPRPGFLDRLMLAAAGE